MNRNLYPTLLALVLCCFGCNKDDEDKALGPAELLANDQGAGWDWMEYHIGNSPAPVPTCVSSGTLWFYSDGQFRQRYPTVITECETKEGTWRFLSDHVFVIQTAGQTDTFQLKELTQNRLVFGHDSVFASPFNDTLFVKYIYHR